MKLKVLNMILMVWVLSGTWSQIIQAASLPDVIDAIKPSVVGIGSYLKTRRPPALLVGTGFVVGDGSYVVTNEHVVSNDIKEDEGELRSVFIQAGNRVDMRAALIVGKDKEHDLALLKITGAPLSALEIGNSDKVREGQSIAFTGFPIGAVLGLTPVTHRGIIAAITPVVIPVQASSQLNPRLIKRMQSPYKVFQLDATAYPGNSGSPVYDLDSRKVIGVINKVFIKESKETVLSKPSGITYAIPSNHIITLLKEAK